ncbi:MAG: iron-containing alcohol dehydrogenase, partial [Candidatus Aminicenantes bacterium]
MITRFHLPTKIIFGSGTVSQVKQIVEDEFKANRIFLVTDKGIRKSGIEQNIISEFQKITVFDDIEPNPKHDTVNRAGEIARKLSTDLVIGLGGG